MEQRPMPKLKIKLKQRQFLPIPNKIFHLNTFSNDRLNTALTSTHQNYFHSPEESSANSKYKKLSFDLTPKFTPSNKLRLSFDDFVEGKMNCRKVLKHSTLNRQQNKMKNKMYIRIISLERNGKSRQLTQPEKQPPIQLKQSLYLETKRHEEIRSQLQQRFSNTRLLMKEEMRSQNFEKIKKLSQRKTLLFKKLNKSDDINQFLRDKQIEKYTPWNREKHYDHEVSEIAQMGQFQEIY